METVAVQVPSELMPLLEDVKIQNNELVNKYLPQDLSIHLSKDKWLWTYRCLDSESDFELSGESKGCHRRDRRSFASSTR